MKIFEFFGKSIIDNDYDSRHIDLDKDNSNQEQEKIRDEIYWYILDHDDLHKKYFLPLAKEISINKKNKDFNIKDFSKKFMPMVNKACILYYKENKMIEDPNELFPKKFRKNICQRLVDQICKDIEKKEYMLENNLKEMMAPPSGPEIPSGGHLSLENDNPDSKTVVDFKKEKEDRQLKNFHKDFMNKINDRASQVDDLIKKFKESGKFPFEIGTRFSTGQSRTRGLPPFKVTGYYVNPKDPENDYGYYYERETEGGIEKSQIAIRNPRLEKHHGSEKWAELQADMKEFKPLKSISERKKSIKQRLDPKCWKGYRKAGTKIKGGVRVNKCVKIREDWEIEMRKLIKLLENK